MTPSFEHHEFTLSLDKLITMATLICCDLGHRAGLTDNLYHVSITSATLLRCNIDTVKYQIS